MSSITNKEIAAALRLTASLGEFHGENEFKLKSLSNAAFQISRYDVPLETLNTEQLLSVPGVGKGIAEKITELIQTGTTTELNTYLKKTPRGILDLLSIKGIGPKKIRTLWSELGIENPGELLYACNENRLIALKGFGEKTQKQISEILRYNLSSKGKIHYAEALGMASFIREQFQAQLPGVSIIPSGELRRCMELCTEITLLLVCDAETVEHTAKNIPELSLSHKPEGELHYLFNDLYLVRIVPIDANMAGTMLLKYTGPDSYLESIQDKLSTQYASEEEFYSQNQLPYVLPELRDLRPDTIAKSDAQTLVQYSDIKGCIHTHTTWSDGRHTIAEMAEACIALGYEYLTVSDHSRSAVYARGLSIDDVKRQHDEIDKLNESYTAFKILKGIESDILYDGALDYPDTILASFDMVIASVHSVLRMDEKKATERILAAIENPYTTILGHPSGRLLLSREAYPLDYELVIDAASRKGVVIELNANRFRMDIDWRHIPHCIEKSVLISVNPDAHQKETISDMRFGIDIARKGALSSHNLFNGFSLLKIEEWLNARKKSN